MNAENVLSDKSFMQERKIRQKETKVINLMGSLVSFFVKDKQIETYQAERPKIMNIEKKLALTLSQFLRYLLCVNSIHSRIIVVSYISNSRN